MKSTTSRKSSAPQPPPAKRTRKAAGPATRSTTASRSDALRSGSNAQGTANRTEPDDPQAAILKAAGEILDQYGYDGLSTTAIARRARVSTGTLYMHYPDKHAVLRALVWALQTERTRAAESQYEAIANSGDWRAPMREAMMAAYRLRMARPGGRSSRRALQTSPELWDWDQRQTEELAASMARAIRRRKPQIDARTASRVALVAVTTSVALLDQASADSRRAPWILKEAIVLREAYLAPYLD
jgi:AcrR family transcriptional regulator